MSLGGLIHPSRGTVKIGGVDAQIENPMVMDEIVAALGAEPVPWPHKTECCGAAATLPHPEAVERLVKRLLMAARAAGAACIAVACPLCHANIDLRQQGVSPMPALYITDLVGLALGLGSTELGIEMHLVSAEPALRGIGRS